jgi:phage/plasmid-associated DNA primase
LHVFATNGLPVFSGGMDRGVQRRLIVLPFTRVIPDEEAVQGIGHRIATEEADALLAFAVEGAGRLLAQERFTEPLSARGALKTWIYESDAVLAWLDAMVELAPGERLPTRGAHASFKSWATAEGFEPAHLPTINTFGQRVRAHFGKAVGKGREGASERVLIGIRIRDDAPKLIEMAAAAGLGAEISVPGVGEDW